MNVKELIEQHSLCAAVGIDGLPIHLGLSPNRGYGYGRLNRLYQPGIPDGRRA